VSSNTGHGGLASVLEGFCLGDGVLWVGSGEVTAVGDVQGAEGEERGSWARSSSSPPLLTARVGAEGAGVDRGGLHEHGYRLEANGNSAGHCELDSLRFCLPGVRRNARKKFKFKFLKFFTLGGHHIRQGFQRYFCYKERLSFAEIIFQILGIVTVSDSIFG
jgi:hypothetical protein